MAGNTVYWAQHKMKIEDSCSKIIKDLKMARLKF